MTLASTQHVQNYAKPRTPISGKGTNVVRTVGGSQIDLRADLSTSPLCHPFKLWMRKYGVGSIEYAVAQQHPDTPAVIAGPLRTPYNIEQNISAKTWTAVSGTTKVWLRGSITLGSISTSWVTTSPSIDINAKPAVMGWHIGTLVLTDGVWSILQLQTGPIDLSGAVIPAWYYDYVDADCEQFLIQRPPRGLAWYGAAQTYERIPRWGTDNAIGEIAAYSSSTLHKRMESTNNTFYLETEYDCDGNPV